MMDALQTIRNALERDPGDIVDIVPDEPTEN
jgi:DNA-binding Xre family transcriptional regulator